MKQRKARGTMKRNSCILGIFLFASSCAAERGDDAPPSPVDAGHESSTDAFTDLPKKEEEAPTDVEPDAGPRDVAVAYDSRAPDALMRWDYNGEPTSGNFYDVGPDGECWIPPGGPWIATDPDSGLAYCIHPPDSWQANICECVFRLFFHDGGFVPRDR